MWRKRHSAPLTALLLLAAMIVGFWGGYRVLPQTGLAGMLRLDRQLLSSALPFSELPGSGETSAPSMESSPQLAQALLAQSGLPTALTLEAPPAEGGQPAGPETALPAKAGPRLIVMEEASIAAYAGLQAPAAAAANAPRILVYCTHSSEEYSDGARVPGARGGVHTVAEKLTEKLNALGLAAIYCDTVHDYPEWNLSYTTSLNSIQALREQYPSLEVFIDVHRDSQANSVLNTATGSVARIMLVVGSSTRLPHPNWKQNKAFSEQIAQALETRVKGITRGVNVQQGRYNQQISPQAILVEMGSTKNSTAEACASAGLLAEAIAEVLGSQ